MDAFAQSLAFDAEPASEYIRGVEIGRLWEQLKSKAGPVEDFVHVSNSEMVPRLAEATRRPVRTRRIDESWLLVMFKASRAPVEPDLGLSSLAGAAEAT
jgi:hypothetical protein